MDRVVRLHEPERAEKAAATCACVRLRSELDGRLSLIEARPEIKLTNENMNRLFVQTPDSQCEISNCLYFDLRDAAWSGCWHYAPRTSANTACARCATRALERNQFNHAATPLAPGGMAPLCGDCSLDLGVDLPPGWPRCDECRRPFPTANAGEIEFGAWVSRICAGESLCGRCWLTEHHAGDRAAMIEHVLRCDTETIARLAVALDFRQMKFEVLDHACCWLWQGKGIFELLRTGAVTLLEAATVIRRRATEIVQKSPARVPAERARARIWLDERRSNPILTRVSV
ncbi:MAG TPA: hypothetical protein VMV27_07850 [Candidatus Binataceae bacterium]|nr:hypothetical protein [Candidatus Binataceae bacterium]